MSASPIVRAPLLGQILGSAANDFAVCEFEEAATPPDRPRGGIPLHRHRSEDEAWYVLSGKLRFQFEERQFDAGAGSGVLLPQGATHTFWNPGPDRARYLLIVRPRTAGLLEALHGPGRPEPAKLHAVYSQFDAELLE